MSMTCTSLCAQLASAHEPAAKKASQVKYDNKTTYAAYSARPLQDVMYSAQPTIGRPANCEATVLGKTGGGIAVADLATIESIGISGRNFEIMSYEFYSVTGEDMKVMAGTGKFLSPDAMAVLRQMQPGQRFLVEGIKAKNILTGDICSLPDLKFVVIP